MLHSRREWPFVRKGTLSACGSSPKGGAKACLSRKSGAGSRDYFNTLSSTAGLLWSVFCPGSTQKQRNALPVGPAGQGVFPDYGKRTRELAVVSMA